MRVWGPVGRAKIVTDVTYCPPWVSSTDEPGEISPGQTDYRVGAVSTRSSESLAPRFSASGGHWQTSLRPADIVGES